MRRRTPKKQTRGIAKSRIDRLWMYSKTEAARRPYLARRWMSNAKSIAQRARLKLPVEVSKNLCKGCGTVYVPGLNCRVRMRGNRGKHLSITCMHCGEIRRFPVIRKS
ncbi:MAG: ribonuclease P [Candidatus Thorarchaeota archaeon]